MRWPPVRASLFWGAIFVALTAVMRAARGDIGEPHVALIYLLLVLGGSVAGGRALGFALAGAGFVAIDYFFQSPYDKSSVGKPLDWTALVAFLATSAVTSELVTRALSEAEAARRRADEVARLSRLGSRALHAGRARDALAALAELIRGTLGVPDCEIYRSGNGGEPVASAVRARDGGGAGPVDDGALVALVAQHVPAAVVRADGTTLQAFAPSTDDDAIGLRRRRASLPGGVQRAR